jgi:hypothetical protein
MSEFAEWRYHAVHGARLFTSETALAQAGAGWLDHPDPDQASKPQILTAAEHVFGGRVELVENKSPVERVAELPKPNPVDYVNLVDDDVTPAVEPAYPLEPVVPSPSRSEDVVTTVLDEGPSPTTDAPEKRKPGRPKK